jgi:hypothetical protein
LVPHFYRCIAKSFLDRKGIIVEKFPDNLPGIDWARGVLKRHNNIVCQRVASNITRSRAEVSPLIISEYFDNLSKVVENIPASNITTMKVTCKMTLGKKINISTWNEVS